MPDRFPHRRKAAEYRERDLAVLRHVFRYGLGLNPMLSAALLGGKEAGHVLRRFGDKNWLVMQRAALPGGITYGTLTAQGAKEIGRQLKPKPLGAVALDTALSVAFYCTLSDARRYRLLPEEIKNLCPGLAVNVPHVVTEEFGPSVVLRIQNATVGKMAAVRKKAAEFFDKASTEKRTAPWIRTQDLGLVLLGQTPQRVLQLEQAIAADETFASYRITVGLGPVAETLAKCLRAKRKES